MYECLKVGKKNLFIVLSVIFFVFADQLIKYEIRLGGGFYICNANLAFGLKFTPLFLVFALTLLVSILARSLGSRKSQALNPKKIQNSNHSNSKRWFNILNFGNLNLFDIWHLKFGALLLTAGAISNLADRMLFGCVIDYINLHFWPVFNLADIFISLGAIMLALGILRKNGRPKPNT